MSSLGVVFESQSESDEQDHALWDDESGSLGISEAMVEDAQGLVNDEILGLAGLFGFGTAAAVPAGRARARAVEALGRRLDFARLECDEACDERDALRACCESSPSHSSARGLDA